MLPEPWNTLAFVILVPVIVQAIKLLADKLGKPIPVLGVQIVAAILAAGFVFLNGGFAGLSLPVYAGDPVAFVSALLALLVAAWGPVELLYRVFLKALFERIGF